jgi:hypothetical protein
MAPVPGPQAGWPQPAPARPNRHRLAKALIPVWSLGFLAFVPFLILAVRQKTAGAWAVFAGYLVAVIAEFALFSGSSGSTASNVGGGLALLLMAGGGMHAWLADPDPDEPVVTGPGNAAAVAHARERMERRTAARELACQNPVMRSELRIGRPDLARSYDDGGLVDVNQVPAWVLSRHLGLTPDEASAVISARDNVGRFVSAAEILQYTSLRPDRFDAIADWMMF